MKLGQEAVRLRGRLAAPTLPLLCGVNGSAVGPLTEPGHPGRTGQTDTTCGYGGGAAFLHRCVHEAGLWRETEGTLSVGDLNRPVSKGQCRV